MAFGYTQPKYGTPSAPKMSPYVNTGSALATAASKKKPTVGDPFGLLSDTSNSPGRINGGLVAPTRQLSQAPVSTPPPAVPQANAAGQTTAAPGAPQAPQVTYDINTDPALQAVSAYTGQSDEQAQAQADKERRDALLAYGDAELVKKVLGENDPLAAAAAANPNSTLKTLSHQKDVGLHDLLNSLTTGGHNLGFSGYRVAQEGELGNQYQSALAQAAGGVNSILDQIMGNLRSAKGQNAQARSQAMGDAYSRQLQWLMTHPPTGAPPNDQPPPGDIQNDPTAGMYYDPVTNTWKTGTPQTGGRFAS